MSPLAVVLPAAQLVQAPPLPEVVLPTAQSTQAVKGLMEVWPAAQLVQEPLSAIDPLLQAHVPPVPVQAPLVPQSA